VRSATIVPDTGSLGLEELVADEGRITIAVRTRRATAICPDCGQPSTRAHSWYRRTVTDLPWQGLAVRLDLHTRRWFCTNPACVRQIFVERLPSVVAPYARRTARLAQVVEALALALGGEGGARLLATLGTPLHTSPYDVGHIQRVEKPPAPTAWCATADGSCESVGSNERWGNDPRPTGGPRPSAPPALGEETLEVLPACHQLCFDVYPREGA